MKRVLWIAVILLSVIAASLPLYAQDGLEFEWHIFRPTGYEDNKFGTLNDAVMGNDGMLYVTDSTRGLWIIDPVTGNVWDRLPLPGLTILNGIDVDPVTGNLYIASWSANGVYVVSTQGELLNTIGSEGTGEGQFGTFSPQNLTIANGELYVMDSNRDESGASIGRIHVFDLDGTFLRSIDVTKTTTFDSAIAVAPNGDIYVAPFAAGIDIYTNDGELILEDFADDEVFAAAIDSIEIGADGRIYMTSWHRGLLVFDSDGTLLGEHGTDTPSDVTGETIIYLGDFGSPNGLEVTDDGVYMIDPYNGQISSITKLHMGSTTTAAPSNSTVSIDDVTFTTAEAAGVFTISVPDNWVVQFDSIGNAVANTLAASAITDQDEVDADQIRIQILVESELAMFGIEGDSAEDILETFNILLGSSATVETYTDISTYPAWIVILEGAAVPNGASLIGVDTDGGIVIFAIRAGDFETFQPIINTIVESIQVTGA